MSESALVSELMQLAMSLLLEDEVEKSIICEANLRSKIASLLIGEEPNGNVYTGSVHEAMTSFDYNEKRFSKFMKVLFAINNYKVENQACNDDQLNIILDQEENSPMWYKLNDVEVLESKLRPFRLESYEYRLERLEHISTSKNNKSLNHRVKGNNVKGKRGRKGPSRDNKRTSQMETDDRPNARINKHILQGVDQFDRILSLRNDLRPSGRKQVKLSQFIFGRLQKEQDPNYMQHPFGPLMLLLLIFKAYAVNMQYVGVRYLELLTDRASSTSVGTLPISYDSTGKFLGLELHSQHNEKFRIVLNVLTHLTYSTGLHKLFDPVYMGVNDELLMYLLKDVNGGLKLKKTFSPINLYFGLKPGKSMSDRNIHCHPTYVNEGVSFDSLSNKCSFNVQYDCTFCQSDNNDEIVYDVVSDKIVKEAVIELRTMGLIKLTNFIKDKLIYMVPSMQIIHDLMFIKTYVNSGGYSRGNQAKDFEPIQEMLERNEKFRKSDDFKKSQLILGSTIRSFGNSVVKRLLHSGAYPNASDFKKRINKWLTQRSAGKTSIEMSAIVGGKLMKMTSTSKRAWIMLLGKWGLDISDVIIESTSFAEYFKTLTDEERERLESGDTDAITKAIDMTGTFKIGSRSVAAYRAIRPIYMVVLTLHLAFAATIGPIVDEISRPPMVNETQGVKNNMYDLLMGDGTYGTTIATTQMDGSLDLIAIPVMASGSQGYIALLSDSSNFDQTSINELSNEFLRGVQMGMLEFGINLNEKYMYNDNVGMNLLEIIDFIIDASTRRHYVTEYNNQAMQFNVDYLASGRLDTFYANSIKNGLMHKAFILKIMDTYPNVFELTSVQVAGDDGYLVLRILKPLTKEIINGIRQIVVNEFQGNNHIINLLKTLLSTRSGEYAKLYWYFGMVFRDPSIQLLESEKLSNAETMVERLRGLSQKVVEFTKRSVGSLKTNMKLNRIIVGLSYIIKFRSVSREENARSDGRVDRTTFRWVVPYMAVITPTSIQSGLGMSLSGISQNEVALLRGTLRSDLEKSLGYIKLIKYTKVKGLHGAILNGVASGFNVPRQVRKSLLRDAGDVESVSDIKYKSSDKTSDKLQFRNGLEFIKSNQNVSNLQKARKALVSLNGRGVTLPLSNSYEYRPFIEFKTMLESFKHEKQLDLDDTAGIIKNIREGKIEASSIVEVVRGFELDEAFTMNLILAPVDKVVQNACRYVSYPNEIREMERKFGSRCGKTVSGDMQGSNQLLNRFIVENGLPYTENDIYNLLLDVKNQGSTGDSRSAILGLIEDTLTALSGDDVGSRRVAASIITDMNHWSDLNVNTATVGSMLEPINMTPSNMEKYVQLRVDYPMTEPMRKLVRFMSFRHLLAMNVLHDMKYGSVEVVSNARTEEIMSKFSFFNNGVTNTRAYVSRALIDYETKAFNMNLFVSSLED